jgi:hypothetical protein
MRTEKRARRKIFFPDSSACPELHEPGDTAGDNDTIFKMKGTQKERFAQTRALGTKRGEELLQALGKVLQPEQVTRLKQISLQKVAMHLFDYPEVREALKLSDKDAEGLHAIHKKLRDNIVIEVKSCFLPCP